MTISLAGDELFVKEDGIDNTHQVSPLINELEILERNDAAIRNQVEILRQHLEALVSLSNNFSDPKVLEISQELDEVLNKLYRVFSSVNRE